MKTVIPDYYRAFHCIASDCRHTCCAGWEIDVDRESAEKYAALDGAIGDELRACMEPAPDDERSDENYVHFRLTPDERCPFLNSDGLCKLIIRLGESSLCRICADHPRFRNFWSDRIEMGLGLACEEAARIILTQPDTMKLEILESDGTEEDLPADEQWLMSVRQELFDDAASRTYAHPAEQRLMEYLIWRHVPDALYDDRLDERVAFIEDSFEKIVGEWHSTGFPDIAVLIEICRKFSNEVEYGIADMLASYQ